MPHGQASKEARVFKNFAAPSGTAGESFITPWTDGVDGDDLSFFTGNDSNSDGIFNWYLQGTKIFRMDHSQLHLDEAASVAATFWGSGGVRLGTAASPFNMAWLGSHQIVRDEVAPTAWGTAGAFGFAAVGSTSVSGLNQTLTPTAQVCSVSGAAATTVLKVSKPPGDFPTVLHLVFEDANVTMLDSGTGAAAEEMSLSAAYVSRADGTLSLLWHPTPAAGNDRWVEIARS